ncbi:MAG: NUDIX hydrolase [Chloroflexota bacterium]
MIEAIRLRACLAAVQDNCILLVPHFNTDAGPVQWNLPGGSLHFGENLHSAALREFHEETGLQASIIGLLDVSEMILPERPWHSVTIAFLGKVSGGELAPEASHPFGEKVPRWLSPLELEGIAYHPAKIIEKALSVAALFD